MGRRLRVLITGGGGYVAKGLHTHLHSKYDITLASRDLLDLTDREAVKGFFLDEYFDIVIHAAVKGGSRLNPNEDAEIAFTNLLMYDNLVRCRDRFDRLIHFGSGAEDLATTPYGFSKHIISKLMKLDPKNVNVKIYAIFDENELDRRFIKSSILRYKNHEPIIIHQDKKMDFFYMRDLASLVEWLIDYRDDEFPVQDISCSYLEKYTLKQIAETINNLDAYEVPILVESSAPGLDYCGTHPVMPFKLIGLEQGIKQTFNILKDESTTTN